VKIRFSELRRIQARMKKPYNRGDCYRAIVNGDRQAVTLSQYFNSKFEILETVDFVAEWDDNPEKSRPELVWVMRGKFEIVLDLPLTRVKSVLP
jgi:hypothetical protein